MKSMNLNCESALSPIALLHKVVALRISCVLALVFLLLPTFACTTSDLESNAPPVITVDVRSEETYVIGEDVIQIYVTATHPSGRAVDLSMSGKPERAQFQVFQNSAAFTWDPIASDVTGDTPRRLVFIAKASNGQTAERVVNVRLRPGNGQPRFLNAASELYDPASAQPLTIDVRVRDDDSHFVTIEMPAHLAPEGAAFEQLNGFEGQFVWNPTLAQRAQRVHTVTFIADDADNEPVMHRVTILMKQKDTGGDIGGQTDRCEAEEIISHTAPGAQRTFKSYIVDAKINPGNARYTSLFLYWTLEDPFNSNNARFQSVEMYKEGDFYRGLIPNQMLEAGESRAIFYNICAYDNSAPDEDETAIVCAPTSVAYSLLAYSPDEPGCLDDATRQDTPATAAAINTEAWENWRACKEREDFHAITIQGGEEAELYVLYSKGSELSLSLVDGNQQPVALTKSPCTGYSRAVLSVPAGQPAQRFVLRAKGNDLAYQVTAFTEEEPGQCTDIDQEPNDSPEQATRLQTSYAQLNAEICEPDDVDIYAVELFAGDQVTFDLKFRHARGDLDMTLFLPSQRNEILNGSEGIAQGWSTDDNESIFYTTPETGLHYLSVESSNTANTYELEMMSACVDSDAFVGNNNRSQAALIMLDEHKNLKLCPAQEDWYRRQGFPNTSLLGELVVTAGGTSADVILEAYNSQGTRIAQSVAKTGRLEIEYIPTMSEAVYFKVRSEKRLIYTFTLLQIDR